MRTNFRIKKFGHTFFVMLSHTQSLEGITSLQDDGLHTPFFDIENCSLHECIRALEELQIKYNLFDVFVTLNWIEVLGFGVFVMLNILIILECN